MAYVGTNRATGSVQLTVLEYFADMSYVHVPCKQQIDLDLDHTRLFIKHLVASSEVLKNRKHRLYYLVPPFGTIMSIDDIVSVEVFFEWFYRNVNNVYAVIENSTTSDFKKVNINVKVKRYNIRKNHSKQSENITARHVAIFFSLNAAVKYDIAIN